MLPILPERRGGACRHAVLGSPLKLEAGTDGSQRRSVSVAARLTTPGTAGTCRVELAGWVGRGRRRSCWRMHSDVWLEIPVKGRAEGNPRGPEGNGRERAGAAWYS